jgi:hypothetical protein
MNNQKSPGLLERAWERTKYITEVCFGKSADPVGGYYTPKKPYIHTVKLNGEYAKKTLWNPEVAVTTYPAKHWILRNINNESLVASFDKGDTEVFKTFFTNRLVVMKKNHETGKYGKVTDIDEIKSILNRKEAVDGIKIHLHY